MKVARGQIRDYLSFSGDIIAASTIDAYSDVAGKVTKIFVSTGDRVEKSAPLAEVDPSKPGMTYEHGIAKAPISGVVIALPVQVGMTITQAVPVARISASGNLEIKTYIPERFISKIRPGLRSEITLDAYPGKVFYGKVTETSPVIDPVSRTMETHIALQNTEGILKAGMFAKVKIITQEKENVVKIPAQSIVRRYDAQYVFVIETDPVDPAYRIAKKRTIVPGIIIDDQVEVLQGLTAGEDVVVRGQTLLEDGSRVNVVSQ
jgi:RND family efflux transporter MFP subunit